MRRRYEENGRERIVDVECELRRGEGVIELARGGMLAGRVRRIISGPILPKCISVVAPEHVRMCVCVPVAYTCLYDIVAIQRDPEIEYTDAASRHDEKSLRRYG